MPKSSDIRIGARVKAIGGKVLGYVNAVHDGQFSFESDGGQYWLPVSSVFSTTHDSVILIYEELGVLRNSSPAPCGGAPAVPDQGAAAAK